MSDRASPAGDVSTPQPSPGTSVVRVTVAELVQALGGDLRGEGSQLITEIASLELAEAHAISFLASPKFVSVLAGSRAGCVIVSPALADQAQARPAVIVTPDPYLYFARLTQWWATRVRPAAAPSIHPAAVVDPSALVAAGVTIGPLAVIEAGAVIESGAVIGPNEVVGRCGCDGGNPSGCDGYCGGVRGWRR